MTLLEIGAAIAGGAWLVAAIVFLRAQRDVPSLEQAAGPEDSAETLGAAPPRIAAVVAGRDDAETLPDTARDLLGQRGVDIRVVCVDDRSTDATWERLTDMASREPRLLPVRIERLPEGWMGKPHALTRGVEAVRPHEPEWLFFTDSDVRFEADALATAIRAAERLETQHLCAVPGLGECSITGEANLLMQAQSMALHMAWVNRDRPNKFVGVGAFNLVRTQAYDHVGGHASLRMEIVEDVKMGLLLRRAGYRSRGVEAPRHAHVAYAPTIRTFVSVLEKNMFAIFRFNAFLASGLTLLYALLFLLPFVVAATGAWIGLAAIAAMWTNAIPAAFQARRFGWSVWPALLSPACLAVPPIAVANSMIRTLARGGVRWRETFYPLRDLRAGLVNPADPESIPAARDAGGPVEMGPPRGTPGDPAGACGRRP